MKLNLPSILAMLILGVTTQAAIIQQPFSSGFANSGNIPDGDTTGWSDERTLSGIAANSITDVSVKLNLTGGFNGDLYAYLSHDGVLVPLLNRVGVTATSPSSDFGYAQSGFNVTLSVSGLNDVHFYDRYSPTIAGGQLTGTWQPDGRAVDPMAAASSLDAATSSRISLGAFNGLNPNGSWTLFIADVSAGGSQSQLTSWEMDIVAVPEPAEWALVTGLISAVYHIMARARSPHARKASRRHPFRT